MKILLASRDFSITGGVGKHLNRLVAALAAAGHEVTALQSLPLDPSPWPSSVAIHTVPLFDVFDARQRPGATRAALDLVERLKPDIVHLHGGSNFELEQALVGRGPAVKTMHSLELCPTGQRYHYALRRLCAHRAGWACLPRIVYKRCSLSLRPPVWLESVKRAVGARASARAFPAVAVASHYARREAIDEGLAPARVHVVPYFTGIPAEASPLPDSPRILFAARIFREKGLDLALRAVARLGPGAVAVDVVGEGPAEPAARRLAGDLGILQQVAFHGWQSDIDPFYRRASALVVPSRLAEPFGIVGIEAMAHARPAVAFAVGGIADWLRDGETGFLARPYDIDEMAARMGEIVRSRERARQMGMAGRRVAAAEYTIAAHVSRLTALYEEVVRG